MLGQLLFFVLNIISFFVGYYSFSFLYKKFYNKDKKFLFKETYHLNNEEIDSYEKYFDTKEERDGFFDFKIELYKRDSRNENHKVIGNIYTCSYGDICGLHEYKLEKL